MGPPGGGSRPAHGEQLLSWHFGGTVREAWHRRTWKEEPSCGVCGSHTPAHIGSPSQGVSLQSED